MAATIPCHPSLIARLRKLSTLVSGILMVGGGAVLAGWWLDVVWLKSILPGWAGMKPNTALAFMFAGAALWFLRKEQATPTARRLGRTCAGVVTAIGLLSLHEYFFGGHVGIDQLLLPAPASPVVVRVSIGGLLNLLLLGSALLLLDVRVGRRFRPAQGLSLLAALVGLVVVLGYVYGATSLTGMGLYKMALHTAVGFILLALGIFGARPDQGWLVIFNSQSAGGAMARRLMPAAILIPAGLGILRVGMQRHDLLKNMETGVALLMAATTFVFMLLIWLNARWLYQADGKRLDAEAELRRSAEVIGDLYNHAPCGYHSLAEDGTFLRINDTELAWLGYQRDELVGRKKLSDLLAPASQKIFQTSFQLFKERGWSHDLEYDLIRKDGTVLPVSINATVLRDDAGNYLMSRSMVADITDRRWADRQLAVENAVTRILAESASIAAAAAKILPVVGEKLAWDIGALWLLERPANRLHCQKVWSADPVLEPFAATLRRQTYVAGSGLPGRIWTSCQPAWIVDVTPAGDFPLATSVAAAGLHGNFGFPVLVSGKLLGVFEFYSREKRPLDEALLQKFRGIGEQIGQFIERKRMEEILAEERELMNTLMDNIPDNIYFKDRHSRFMRVNQAMLKLMNGTDVAQFLGKTDFDFFSAEHARQTFADEQRIMQTGEPLVNIEEKETWPDGSVTWVSTTKECLRDKEGRVIGTFGVSRDITGQKRAVAALEHERFLLHALMDNLPDRIYFKDLQSRFLRNNRAHLQHLGLTDPSQALGKSDADFFAPQFARQTQAGEQEIMQTGQPFTKEERVLFPDGREDWMWVTKMPLRDVTGQIVGTFGISRDITERKLVEKQLALYAGELRQKNDQIQEELKMACELQQALLPQQFPSIPPRARPTESALQFFTFYNPGGNVSGDYFNIVPLSDSAAGIFICDVMGHDVRAALVTAMIRAFVQDLNALAGNPSTLLTEINRSLAGILKQTGTVMYATASYLVVDVAHARLLYANAGHPHPLHLHGVTGDVDAIQAEGSTGPALGLFDDTVYATHERPIAAGDLLLLFTDGLFEVEGRDQAQFSHEQLRAAVRRHAQLPPSELLDTVLAEVKQFSANQEFTDDVCVVATAVQRLASRPEEEERAP